MLSIRVDHHSFSSFFGLQAQPPLLTAASKSESALRRILPTLDSELKYYFQVIPIW